MKKILFFLFLYYSWQEVHACQKSDQDAAIIASKVVNASKESQKLIVDGFQKIFDEFEEHLRLVASGNEKSEKDILDFINKHRSCINKQNKFGQTPLMLAAKYKCEKIIKELLSHGADGKIYDEKKLNAGHYLMKSASNGFNCLHCRKLLALKDFNDLYTNLVLYCLLSREPEKKAKIEPGILQKIGSISPFINDLRGSYGETLLILAVKFECISAIELLLSYGAAIETQDNHGRYAYDYALKYIPNNEDLLKRLVPNGFKAALLSPTQLAPQSSNQAAALPTKQIRRKAVQKAAKKKKEEDQAAQTKIKEERFKQKLELEQNQAKERAKDKLNEHNLAKAITHFNAKIKNKRQQTFKAWHNMTMTKQKLDVDNQLKAFNIYRHNAQKKAFNVWKKTFIAKRECDLQKEKANRLADFKRRFQACQNSLSTYKVQLIHGENRGDLAYANLYLSSLRFAQYFSKYKIAFDLHSSQLFKEIYEICSKEYGEKLDFESWLSKHSDYVPTQEPNEYTLSLLDAVRAQDYRHAFAILRNKKVKLDANEDLKTFYAYLRAHQNQQDILKDAAIFGPGMQNILKQYVIAPRVARACQDIKLFAESCRL